MKSLIDWEVFRPVVEGIYDNRTEKGGHPNYDEVPMIKIMVLLHSYSLSDQKMELEMAKKGMKSIPGANCTKKWNLCMG